MERPPSSFLGPILAVGAVVFKGDHILLVKRAHPPFMGHWSIPGGKVDHGETLLEALHREIMEEAGITIEVCGLIDPFEAPATTPSEKHFVMIDYIATWVAGTARAGDDALEAKFFPLNEAREKVAWDETRTALEMALEIRSKNNGTAK